ncbi:MAG: hypothetical protein AAF681_09440 [Pseudomonadota bacterium]
MIDDKTIVPYSCPRKTNVYTRDLINDGYGLVPLGFKSPTDAIQQEEHYQ